MLGSPPVRQILGQMVIPAIRTRRVRQSPRQLLGNEHWHVWTATGQRYVLRRHAPMRTREDLAYEAEVLQHLALQGWTVPLPVRTPVGQGDRLVSLVAYIPGRGRSGESPRQQRARGVLLARMQADLRPLMAGLGQRPSGYQLHDLAAMQGVLAWREGLEALRATRPELAEAAVGALDWVRRWMDIVRPDRLPTSIVHGDFTPWNVYYEGVRLAGVVDFDLAHLDSRSADLATARAASRPALLQGYRAEAEALGWPLTDEEEHAIPTLDAAMRVGIVAWEMHGLHVAGTMDVELVERQLQRLESARAELDPRSG